MKIRWASTLVATIAVLQIPAYAGSHDYIVERNIIFERIDHPYFEAREPSNRVVRVNIDLSTDGGATWPHVIARGYPAALGTNVYPVSIKVTPDMWTEQARLRVMTLWAAASTNQLNDDLGQMHGQQSELFVLGGIKITSPAAEATVYAPSYTPVEWREAGEDYVTIGISTNAGATYQPMTYIQSAITNRYVLAIPTDIPTGPAVICVHGENLSIVETVNVNINNLLE